MKGTQPGECIMHCKELIPQILRRGPETLLDIGAGHDRTATDQFLTAGIEVTSLDIEDYREIVHPLHTFLKRNYVVEDVEGQYDAILASHILEHVQDTGVFLRKIRSNLAEDGLLYLAVPPLKHEIVGGHVHLWNMGLIMYNLILSGFNVRDGSFRRSGYSLMAIVGKESRELPELRYDRGDIEALKDFWPAGREDYFTQGFDGRIDEMNWDGH